MKSFLSIAEGLTALLFIKAVAAYQLETTTETLTIINVDIYYESLCSDSRRFIEQQLVPAYPDLKDHLSISFIPYGKAMHSKEEANGPWEFVCQHGQDECRGNRGQACGINEIKTSVKSMEEQQQRLVDLVGCVMTADSPASAVTLCAQQIGLPDESKNRIVACESSALGNNLLAAYGDTTHALKPRLSFVPTIVINGVYSKENQAAALKNFRNLICNYIPTDEQPATCKVDY